jgi:hypothetical protein
LAVFTAFNILANYKFPLNEALAFKDSPVNNRIFHSPPKYYAYLYLSLIPLYAIFYISLPDNTISQAVNFIDYIYFSTVTITTLGYGDMLPQSSLGKIFTASQSIFGITLIGLFLNSLSRVRSEAARDEEMEKEQKQYRGSQVAKLNGIYNLIKPLSGNYKLSVIQITSPLANRSNEYNPDFTLNDMKDLYGPSLLLTQNHHEPAVKYYLSANSILNKEFSDLIKNVDLRLFPELEKHSHSLVGCFHSFNFSDFILGALNTTAGDRKMTEFISEMLEKHEGEVKFLNANMINAYVALYQQIKMQMELLAMIEREITQLIQS